MKYRIRIGILDIIQIVLIFLMAVCVILFVLLKIDLDILALLISIISLAITSLSVISKNIEEKRPIELRVHDRQYDEGLFNDVEKQINELKNKGYKIDSVYFSDASGWNDHRKEALIIYH